MAGKEVKVNWVCGCEWTLQRHVSSSGDKMRVIRWAVKGVPGRGPSLTAFPDVRLALS